MQVDLHNDCKMVLFVHVLRGSQQLKDISCICQGLCYPEI